MSKKRRDKERKAAKRLFAFVQSMVDRIGTDGIAVVASGKRGRLQLLDRATWADAKPDRETLQ